MSHYLKRSECFESVNDDLFLSNKVIDILRYKVVHSFVNLIRGIGVKINFGTFVF